MRETDLPKKVRDLAEQVERHRRALGERLDVSPRLRQLSRSAIPQALLPEPLRRSPAFGGAVLVAALALLGACAISGVGVAAGGLWLQGALGSPATTAQNYYSALHEQDYSHAYGYLSPAAQQRTSRDAFVAQYTSLDAVAGIVESYTVESANAQGTTASVVAEVVRRADTTRAQTQLLTLVQNNGSWQIDRITVGDSAPAPNQ